MHFIIVEDLSSDRDSLLSLIKEACRSQMETATFSCYEKAEEFLAAYRPGLASAIFLDILLPKTTGLFAARVIRQKDARVPIVFVTSEPGYSLESYSVHALDFLVKPILPAQLSWCIEQITRKQAAPLFLTVKEARKADASHECMIPLEDLIYAESIRNGLIIHTTWGEVRTGEQYGFSEVMRLLPPNGQFCVFSRGEMVNLSHVLLVSQKGEIRLRDGRTLYCSRRKIHEVQKLFADYRINQFREKEIAQ